MAPFCASVGPFPQGSPMENKSRTVRTVQGYQGFALKVNGVLVSTLVCHGEVAHGGNLEREYAVPDGIRSLWHISETPFDGDGGVRVSLAEFKAIAHRHGLAFDWRKI